MKFGSNEVYENRVHAVGRVTLLVTLFLTFLFPLSLWLIYGIKPTGAAILNSFISTSAALLPASIIELFSYAPIVGSSGMYMMTLTGGYNSLRIPAALTAQSATGVEPNTEQSDIISTIGIAVSVFVSVTIIALTALLMVPLQPVMSNPVLQPAFNAVLPALFITITVGTFMQNPKHCIAPLIVGVVITVFKLVPSDIALPVNLVLGLVVNRILYKLKWI